MLVPSLNLAGLCPLFAVRSDVRVKKLYIGAMGIGDQPFLPDYEDQNSTQFTRLASLVNQQVSRASSCQVVLGMDCNILFSYKHLPLKCNCVVCILFFQLKLIYSKNSVLAKAFKGSSIQAFRYKLQSSAMLQIVPKIANKYNLS